LGHSIERVVLGSTLFALISQKRTPMRDSYGALMMGWSIAAAADEIKRLTRQTSDASEYLKMRSASARVGYFRYSDIQMI
jgi:hypothetical protein